MSDDTILTLALLSIPLAIICFMMLVFTITKKFKKKNELFHKITATLGALLLIGMGYAFIHGTVNSHEASFVPILPLGIVMIPIGIGLLYNIFLRPKK